MLSSGMFSLKTEIKMDRLGEFDLFKTIVRGHIEKYTIPQYGDAPNDQVENFTPAQCMDSIKRYANRIDSNARGRLETLRDMLKIAQYACVTFYKLNPTFEEIKKLSNGGI